MSIILYILRPGWGGVSDFSLKSELSPNSEGLDISEPQSPTGLPLSWFWVTEVGHCVQLLCGCKNLNARDTTD